METGCGVSHWDEAMREAYEEQTAYGRGGGVKNPRGGIIGESGHELMLPLESRSVTLHARSIFGMRGVAHALANVVIRETDETESELDVRIEAADVFGDLWENAERHRED